MLPRHYLFIMAVLLAPPEAGKSVLAMQIAESIARGRSIGPLQMSKKPRRVPFIDLVLTRRQFEWRYSSEETGKRPAAHLVPVQIRLEDPLRTHRPRYVR